MDDEPVMFVHFTGGSPYMKRSFPCILFLVLHTSLLLSAEEPVTPDRTPFTFDLEFDWIGLGVNRRHPHRVLSGTQAEASLEWGPRFLFNAPAGEADFLRLNLTARAFLPLFDLDPDNAFNVCSAYAGFFAAVDWATGGNIPLNVRGYFGGRAPRKGLGFAVRGLEDGRLDAPFKAVANAEVRFSLPALIDPSIIPGFLVFADAGYYDLVDAPGNGFVFSAGAGLTLSLFDALNLCFTTQFLLNGTKVTGDIWTPVYFEFIWHF